MILCAAGREADFGGRWFFPCMAPMDGPVHWLHSEGLAEPIPFCNTHMQQLIAAGLIPHVDVEEADIERLKEHYRQHQTCLVCGEALLSDGGPHICAGRIP